MKLNINGNQFPILSRRTFLFVKFESFKYVDSFVHSGVIHFGSTRYYRNVERKKGNVGIGDKYDGLYTYSREELNNMIMDIDGYKLKMNLQEGVLGFNFSFNQYIFCLSNINVFKNFSNDSKKNRLEKELYDSLFSDSRYPKKIVVIINPSEFFSKLTRALILMGYDSSDIIRGPVIYSDYRNDVAHILSHRYDHYPTNRGPLYWINFVKNTKFRNEREFRVTIPSLKSHPTGLNIPVGSVFNDVIVFNNLKDFINHISIMT